MGVKRTRELINLCSEPERSLLLQFIDVYDEQEHAAAPATAAVSYSSGSNTRLSPTRTRSTPPASRSTPARSTPRRSRLRRNSTPTPQPTQQPTPAEQWQQHANAKTRGGDYNPFGEHQDLVLGLIKVLIDDAQRAPAVVTNGNGHANY